MKVLLLLVFVLIAQSRDVYNTFNAVFVESNLKDNVATRYMKTTLFPLIIEKSKAGGYQLEVDMLIHKTVDFTEVLILYLNIMGLQAKQLENSKVSISWAPIANKH